MVPMYCSGTSPRRRPRKAQRSHDRELIENFFARLKQYRAIAVRYGKTASVFPGAIHLAAAVAWLNG